MANANFFSPDGGITRYPLEDTEGRITYEEEIHGINLLENKATSQTINGVTFTVNADGSVTANGTATATVVTPINLAIKSKLKENEKYILSGCPSGGATNKYKLDFRTVTASLSTDAIYNDIGEGVEFTLTSAQYSSYELGVSIRIENGFTVNNLTFYPMITEAKYAGVPYRPFNQQSIQHQINDVTGVTGVRNFGAGKFHSSVEFGVTFTVDENNVVNVNGTNTHPTGGAHCKSSSWTLKKGSYILSTGSKSTHTWLRLLNSSNAAIVTIQAEQDEKAFNLSDDTVVYYDLVVENGGSETNYKAYPMIRLASDPSDEYVPYAMTNRELTEAKANIHDGATNAASGDALVFRRDLTSSDNLNSLFETGIFGIKSSAGYPSNLPSGESSWNSWGYVISLNMGFRFQFVVNGVDIFCRYYGSSGWGAWRKFTSTVL